MKRARICLFALILLLISILWLSAQGPDTMWTRAYGGSHDDCCYSVIESSTGGYVLAGWTLSFGAGKKDVYLLKVDVNGDTAWTRTFGGPENEEGRDVKETYDGGCIIAGWTESFGSGGSDVYLVKTDANGNEEWTTSYGLLYNEYANAVQQTPDSGYIIAGRFNSFGYGGYDIFIVKFDQGGNPLWAGFAGDSLWNVGNSMLQTSDGGFIIAGSTMHGTMTLNVYLVKVDAYGDTIWDASIGGSSWELGDEVRQTLDGGFIVAGMALTATNSSELFLAKIDSTGTLEWSRTHGYGGWDEGHSVEVLSDGGYLLAGESESVTGDGFDVYLSRTFPNGFPLWAELIGGSSHDYGYSAKVTSDGGYIIAGKTKSYGNGLHDVYVIKTQPDLGIEEYPDPYPCHVKLAVSPNPFNSLIEIAIVGVSEHRSISVPEIRIFDVTGRKVRDLILYPSSLILEVTWDGRDEKGYPVPSGVYYVRFKDNNSSLTKKLLRIR
jgi:hypothetical protein